MDGTTIDLLSANEPAARLEATVAQSVITCPGSPLHKQAAQRFMSRYTRPAFGWYIASQFATHQMSFPLTVCNRDYWVFRAYIMLLDPWNNYDSSVAEAFHLAHMDPSMTGVLKSLIMSYDDSKPESHLQGVANRTGLPYATVEAFESLFYNILDRREDSLYIAHEIYPHTRVVELDEDYYRNSPVADLLKRAGYNTKDMDFTAYLSGIGDRTYMQRLAQMDNREAELSKVIMGNGLLLTRTNLLNQRSVGLSRAATLLAASRQAGSASEDPPLASVSPLIYDELQKAINAGHSQTVAMMRQDAGAVVDV